VTISPVPKELLERRATAIIPQEERLVTTCAGKQLAVDSPRHCQDPIAAIFEHVSNCSTPLPRREGEGIGKTVTLLLQTHTLQTMKGIRRLRHVR